MLEGVLGSLNLAGFHAPSIDPFPEFFDRGIDLHYCVSEFTLVQRDYCDSVAGTPEKLAPSFSPGSRIKMMICCDVCLGD